jgi:hypothetical protein
MLWSLIIFMWLRRLWLGLKQKRFFPFSRKAKMSKFSNVHGQYSCLICFEAPSGVANSVHYCCPICCEAPSGCDILRYFTIFPVSCVRFLIHFRFREIFVKIFVIFITFCKLFLQKAEINFHEMFAKIQKRKFFV